MSFTSVTIISPEAANGRNVVALGVTKALAAAGKTGVFRPAVCRKDTFTDVLIEASNAGLSREQSVGVCPKRARNDKEGSRADIVAAYTQAVETARPDAMVIVGTDRSAVNDPAMFSFNADFAADLQSPVLLAVCTIERTPEQVKSTVEASTKVIEDAGSKVVGVFITGCDDTQPDPLKACFVDYPVPVWTLPAVDFTTMTPSARQTKRSRRRRRRGTDRGTRIAIRRPDHTLCFPIRSAGQGEGGQEDHRAAGGQRGSHHQSRRLSAGTRHRRSDHRRRRKTPFSPVVRNWD